MSYKEEKYIILGEKYVENKYINFVRGHLTKHFLYF